ncbi:uncharacterized protein An08g02320 [Aspergillus niger]|uniref:Aspergillus niger contig An08c0090, genomic contig n=1 Tax=Aspergillus niger TaxID=5061 RepID=A2QQF2_ASPNG|nr:uncharacterized protein An08g02320 [Aspergillus niger]CAK48226.1 unnamed protein product [Aspergillus niger]
MLRGFCKVVGIRDIRFAEGRMDTTGTYGVRKIGK